MIGINPFTGMPEYTPKPKVVSMGGSGGAGGRVDTIIAGTNITVDSTNPKRPIVSAFGGGGGGGQAWSVNKESATTPNGSTTLFTVPETYIADTLKVYFNGQLLRGNGNDYSETTSTSFTFTTAPISSDAIVLEYRTI